MTRHALQMTLSEMVDPYRGTMKRSFVLLVAIFIGFLLWITEVRSFTLIFIALAIFVLAMVPSYLWITRRVQGFPIAPVIGIAEIFLFTVPILTGSQALSLYTDAEIARAGMLEIYFLLSFIAAWLFFARRSRPLPDRLLALPMDRLGSASLDRLWMIALLVSTLYAISFAAGWFDRGLRFLPDGARGLFRAVFLTIGVASAFFLGLSTGLRTLRPLARAVFIGLLLLHMMATGAFLILAGIVPMLFASLIGFVIGRGRIPWATVVAVAVTLQILHVGKVPLRQEYWAPGASSRYVSVAQYPALYRNWLGHGLRLQGIGQGASAVEETDDLLERASLIQMVLYAQVRAPETISFLNGKTIAIIPRLLVPRVIWPNKPRTHEGQIILNTHFGRQSLEETERTYIAWGMLAEFYANFGTKGALLLGLSLGALVGWVTSFSANLPLGTWRSLIAAVFFMSMATATQMALSTWFTSTFQALVATSFFAFLVMKRIPVEDLMPDDHDAEA